MGRADKAGLPQEGRGLKDLVGTILSLAHARGQGGGWYGREDRGLSRWVGIYGSFRATPVPPPASVTLTSTDQLC